MAEALKILRAELNPSGIRSGWSINQFKLLGGEGSGNYGHAGRPGEVGGSSLSGRAYYTKQGGWAAANGEGLPPHVAAMSLPPKWKDVKFDPNPRADLVAQGKDGKGRIQSLYSEAHWAQAGAEKFARITELMTMKNRIAAENAGNLKNPGLAESAACMRLVMETGIRPGSTSDTGAKVQAYGATTLEGRHVVAESDGVRLRFVGKHGVALDIPVRDEKVASDLVERASQSGRNGKLFDTDSGALLAYSRSLDGGRFTTKDMRTLMGTETAMRAVKRMDPPKSFAEYRRSVKEVAKEVSSRLGNTPTVALQSYINPSVFSGWRRPGWVEKKT